MIFTIFVVVLENFIKAFIVGIGASIPMGPIGILCVQKTISKGKYAGFFTGVGASFADTFYSGLALLSLAFIQEWIEDKKIWVMMIGGAIILLIGMRIAVKNPVKQIQKPKESGNTYFSEILQGFIITITNPGALVLMLGVFAFVGIDISTSPGYMVGVVLAGVLLGTNTWWYTLCSSINKLRKKITVRTLLYINRVAGIIIGSIGLFSLIGSIFKFLISIN